MIYLLEDDESIRKLVTYTLQHAGYEAAGLSCPSAFWAAMKRQTPELVLLDIMLPEEDGLSVLKKLRGSALWRELPVVMLTAKNAEYDRVVGRRGGRLYIEALRHDGASSAGAGAAAPHRDDVGGRAYRRRAVRLPGQAHRARFRAGCAAHEQGIFAPLPAAGAFRRGAHARPDHGQRMGQRL